MNINDYYVLILLLLIITIKDIYKQLLKNVKFYFKNLIFSRESVIVNFK
jgi:hypothetical protein